MAAPTPKPPFGPAIRFWGMALLGKGWPARRPARGLREGGTTGQLPRKTARYPFKSPARSAMVGTVAVAVLPVARRYHSSAQKKYSLCFLGITGPPKVYPKSL